MLSSYWQWPTGGILLTVNLIGIVAQPLLLLAIGYWARPIVRRATTPEPGA